jgi:hypothetical protein
MTIVKGLDKGQKINRALTKPVNVHPGTRRCTDVFVSLRSKFRCSARLFTAALLALYAAFPGGFVMPCLEPVMTIAEGLSGLFWKSGTNVFLSSRFEVSRSP